MIVSLYIYDLSHGLARSLSIQLLGFHIDAIYHTSIVLDGVEYYYGASGGIQMCRAGTSPYGPTMGVEILGETPHSKQAIADHVQVMKREYAGASYDVFKHNCNHFSNDFAQFLVRKMIPEHIRFLPNLILQSPLGPLFQQQINLSAQPPSQSIIVTPGTPNSTPPQRHPHEALLLRRIKADPVFVFCKTEPDTIFTYGEREDSERDNELDSMRINGLTPDDRHEAKLVWEIIGNTRQVLSEPRPVNFLDKAIGSMERLRMLLLGREGIAKSLAKEVEENSLLVYLLNYSRESGRPSEFSKTVLDLACNYFCWTSSRELICQSPLITNEILRFTIESILDKEEPEQQRAASALVSNMCTVFSRLHSHKEHNNEAFTANVQVELVAAILNGLGSLRDFELGRNLLRTLACLIYKAPLDGDLLELCQVMEAKQVIEQARPRILKADGELMDEVISLLEAR